MAPPRRRESVYVTRLVIRRERVRLAPESLSRLVPAAEIAAHPTQSLRASDYVAPHWAELPITGPAVIAQLTRGILGTDLAREYILVFVLDTKQHVLGYDLIAVGGIACCEIIAPCEVFRAALLVGGTSVVLVHNHPSNDPTPSENDVELTRRLVDAGRLLNLPVTDHVIVADHSHYTFTEKRVVARKDD